MCILFKLDRSISYLHVHTVLLHTALLPIREKRRSTHSLCATSALRLYRVLHGYRRRHRHGQDWGLDILVSTRRNICRQWRHSQAFGRPKSEHQQDTCLQYHHLLRYRNVPTGCFSIGQAEVAPSAICNATAFLGCYEIAFVSISLSLSSSLFINEATSMVSAILPEFNRVTV